MASDEGRVPGVDAAGVPGVDAGGVPGVDAGRILGVDAGTVRIGLAVSDPGALIATPLGTVAAGEGELGRVAEAARVEGCETVVVGLPKAMSGKDTASTARARALADGLRSEGFSVELWDERLSSVEAERLLIGAGRRREDRKQEVDRVAAAIILQGWLDARRTG